MSRILIVGFGDLARRTLKLLGARHRVYALCRRRETFDQARALGALPIRGDLDERVSLRRLSGLADIVLHFAPPPPAGTLDSRTRNLIAALARSKADSEIRLQRLVYVSTTGVYGDCGGAQVSETWPRNPGTPRARRRIDAEARLRAFARTAGVSLAILRAPGIYAAERLPLERLKQGTAALIAAEDVYTNHIHADDLARAVIAAMSRGNPNRAYNAADSSTLKMGDYFDAVAAKFGLPPPPRVTRAEAIRKLPESLLSFMGESRRISNARLLRELKVRLRYPTVKDFLATEQPLG